MPLSATHGWQRTMQDTRKVGLLLPLKGRSLLG